MLPSRSQELIGFTLNLRARCARVGCLSWSSVYRITSNSISDAINAQEKVETYPWFAQNETSSTLMQPPSHWFIEVYLNHDRNFLRSSKISFFHLLVGLVPKPSLLSIWTTSRLKGPRMHFMICGDGCLCVFSNTRYILLTRGEWLCWLRAERPLKRHPDGVGWW